MQNMTNTCKLTDFAIIKDRVCNEKKVFVFG